MLALELQVKVMSGRGSQSLMSVRVSVDFFAGLSSNVELEIKTVGMILKYLITNKMVTYQGGH